MSHERSFTSPQTVHTHTHVSVYLRTYKLLCFALTLCNYISTECAAKFNIRQPSLEPTLDALSMYRCNTVGQLGNPPADFLHVTQDCLWLCH